MPNTVLNFTYINSFILTTYKISCYLIDCHLHMKEQTQRLRNLPPARKGQSTDLKPGNLDTLV